MTLKISIAQVVETSATVTKSSFKNNTYLDDHTTRTSDTSGFKPFTMQLTYCTQFNLATISILQYFILVHLI